MVPQQQQQQQQQQHPGRSPPCASPGNPVFSCMLEAALLRARSSLPEPRRLLHKTTSGDYGALPPTAQTAPCRYFPRDNALTDLLFACGKNQYSHGINTGLDKSRVCDHLDALNLTGCSGRVRLGRGAAAPTPTPQLGEMEDTPRSFRG